MCEPALRGLRSVFPQAEVTLLAKAAVAELFAGHPGPDRLLLYDYKRVHAGLAGKWALAGMLRPYRFDCAVLFQNAFEAAFLTWLAAIPRRFGYATDGRAFFLTDPVAVPDRRSPVHHVDYYWNMLKPLGVAGKPSRPTLTVSADEERRFGARLEAAGVAPSDILIGINPGSTYGGAKRWLPYRFAEAAERLAGLLRREEDKPVTVAILGAPGEEQVGREIAARVTGHSVLLSGATTVRELMAAAKRCRLLLTNDTGPMHIAAAFGVPVVAVFGPTDWRTTAPFGQEQSVVREPVDCAPCLLRECPIDHRCMTRVSVERVYEAAVRQLRAGQQTSPKLIVELTGNRLTSENSSLPTSDLSACHPSSLSAILDGYTIFLDRDGTLNPDPGYIRSPDQYELLPGVPEALAKLKQAGARLVVVTNQSGVARGLLSLADLDAIHRKLKHLLRDAGAPLDAIYFCPHHPEEQCHCRKPNTGMIDQAVRDDAIDLARSYLVGDEVRDMELAKRIGARSILVSTGQDQSGRAAASESAEPHWIASSLADAADWILSDAERRRAHTDERQSTFREAASEKT
jgi:heptosyltransferase-2